MSKALLHELGRSISFGRLSLEAKVLWPMLLASSDDQGRGIADPDVVSWQVCPNVRELDVVTVESALNEMGKQGMLDIYTDERGRKIYQIIRWWEWQQPQWAAPSRFAAPDGWTDRIRYNAKGRTYVEENWKQPGGFEPCVVAEKAPAEEAVEIGTPVATDVATPIPTPNSYSDNIIKHNIIKRNEKEKKKDAASAAQTRAPPTNSPHDAIEAYRSVMELYPAKTAWARVIAAVGDDPADVERWHETCLAWSMSGWNPTNVRGILKYFEAEMMPGDDPELMVYAKGET